MRKKGRREKSRLRGQERRPSIINACEDGREKSALGTSNLRQTGKVLLNNSFEGKRGAGGGEWRLETYKGDSIRGNIDETRNGEKGPQSHGSKLRRKGDVVKLWL